MKVTAQPFYTTAALDKGRLAVYLDLFKARLTGLVLLTTLAGFYLGSRGQVDYLAMLHTVLGTGLIASGAAALNELWERQYDARMSRTQDRPLPSGRLQPAAVLRIGVTASALGMVYLLVAVNPVTAGLGALSLVTYLFLYTPLKRVTWLNTAVGALPGALPPLIGWTGARGGWSSLGLTLFAIQALWQIPHFMAIAWLYREDYARAGFKMLPVLDPDGRQTGRQACLHATGLLPISLLPFFLHLAGPAYLVGALMLGLAFVGFAVQFARELTDSRARQLFFLSIVYLPAVFILMVVDKIN